MTQQQNNRKPRILVLEGLRDAASAVRRAGATAVSVNPKSLASIATIKQGDFDGVLLTGGGDVDPRQYGEKPHRKVYGVNEIRDHVELFALDLARDMELPVMGICRGMQLIAVHNGGRLKQHVEGHRGLSHLVFSEPSTRYRKATGASAGMFVSLHHQRVLRTGPNFRVAARCREGGIEAIESKDGRVLAVQFHPEMDVWSNSQSRKLFRWLVKESARRAGLPTPTPTSGYRRDSRPRSKSRPSPRPTQLMFPTPKPVARKRSKPVASRWFCRDCGMEFDHQVDRDDHEFWLHTDPVIRTTEPPPGHPDWMEASS